MEKNNKGAEAADLIKQEEAGIKNEAAMRSVPSGEFQTDCYMSHIKC